MANGWYESDPLSGSQIATIEAENIASEAMCNLTETAFPRYDTMDRHFFTVLREQEVGETAKEEFNAKSLEECHDEAYAGARREAN